MLHTLSILVATLSVTEGPQKSAVSDAQRKCVKASEGPAPHPAVQLPVEKFDECIVAEANKWPLKTRRAICALGKSGGPYRSGVEVYMANGWCRTDYE